MSLSKNIATSYLSQIYVTVISILMVPVYLKYMGTEAYGLVGFYAMLQSWFNLLDLGLTPTVARETARFQGGAMAGIDYRRLVRVLEGIFVTVAVIGGLILFFASGFIARHWLKVRELPTEQVVIALKLTALIIAFRWTSGLYRGVISGFQRLVWLGGYNAAVATLRFVAVIPWLIFVGSSPSLFFSFQLAVAACELLILSLAARRLLPLDDSGKRSMWSWAPIKPFLKFSLSIAFTSSVWVLITQTDKLILSKLLPLAEYGRFTLAVMVASGVNLLSLPVGNALMPKMATLEAEGNQEGLIRIYRQTTRLVAVIAGSAAISVAFCSESLLWAWTGDRALAQQGAPILSLYGIGNGILAISAFPYYLQYAKGDLRLHLIGNAVFVGLIIPLIILAANYYGALGAGYVWVGMNLFTFVVWFPLVHRKFVPRLGLEWISRDVLRIIGPPAICMAILRWFFRAEYQSRKIELMALAILSTVVLAVALVVERRILRRFLNDLRMTSMASKFLRLLG